MLDTDEARLLWAGCLTPLAELDRILEGREAVRASAALCSLCVFDEPPVNQVPIPCVYFWEAPAGDGATSSLCVCSAIVVGLVSTPFDGREKFLAKAVCALSASSTSATFDNLLVGRVEARGEAGPASALELRFPFVGGGDEILMGASRLEAGLCMLCAIVGAVLP